MESILEQKAEMLGSIVNNRSHESRGSRPLEDSEDSQHRPQHVAFHLDVDLQRKRSIRAFHIPCTRLRLAHSSPFHLEQLINRQNAKGCRVEHPFRRSLRHFEM